MTSHTCQPGHRGILADGCDRCREHAETPALLDLDRQKLAALWTKMVAVEYHDQGGYETVAERIAARALYTMSLWLQRNLRLEADVVSVVLDQNAAEGGGVL